MGNRSAVGCFVGWTRWNIGGTNADRVLRVTTVAVIVLVAGLALGVGTGGAVEDGIPENDSPESAVASSDAPTQIEQRTELRLVENDSKRVEAEVSFQVPETVNYFGFSIRRPIEQSAYDADADGFVERHPGQYYWNGSGDHGSITIRYDRTFLDHDYMTVRGAPDDWAVTQSRPISSVWSSPGVDIVSETVVADNGTTAGTYAVLGAHESYVAYGTNETIELVVPEAADMVADPTEIVASLETASEQLRVGNENENVNVTFLVVPSDDVDTTVSGFASGPNAVVLDSKPLARSSGGNTWIHEYVHMRQPYYSTDEIKWLVEGSADYYASTLSLQQGLIDYDQFETHLERGTDENAVLSDPYTWDYVTFGPSDDYTKGALVVAAIDREIRLATGGEATFQDVFREWNAGGTFDAEAFETAIETVAGSDVRAFVEEYTRTDATPETWSVEDHAKTFDVDSWSYHVATDGSLRAELNSSTSMNDVTLVPGDRIVVTGADDTPLKPSDGMIPLEPGSDMMIPTSTLFPEGTVPLYGFEDAGDHEITLGGQTTTVSVREPVAPQVDSFDVSAENVSVGDSVTLNATVSNPTDRPTTAVAILSSRDNYTVDFDQTRFRSDDAWSQATLGPNESTTLSVTRAFDEPGSMTAATINRSLEITVDDPRASAGGNSNSSEDDGSQSSAADESVTERETAGTTDDDQRDPAAPIGDDAVPGFSLAAALVCLVIVAVLSGVRRRSV